MDSSYVFAGGEMSADGEEDPSLAVDHAARSGWPNFDVEEVEGFEVTPTASSLLSHMSLPLDDPEGPLLDAFARLHAEQAKSERLEMAVEVARALGGLSNSGRPAAAATTIQAALRGQGGRCVARSAHEAAREAHERHRARAARALQAGARARAVRRALEHEVARRLQDALRSYMAGLPRVTKTRLRCEVLRERAGGIQRAEELRTVLRAKEAAIEKLIDMQVGWRREGRERCEAAARQEELEVEIASRSAELADATRRSAELEVQNASLLARLEARQAPPPEPAQQRPAGAASPVAVPVARAVGAQESPRPYALPAGWEMRRAPTGRTYYYNAQLEHTQWDPPVATARAVAVQAVPPSCAAASPVPLPTLPSTASAPGAVVAHAVHPPAASAASAVVPVPAAMERDMATRLRAAEELAHRLEVENADLAAQLHQSQQASAAIAEEATALRLAKEEAEDNASALLARQLSSQEEDAQPHAGRRVLQAASGLASDIMQHVSPRRNGPAAAAAAAAAARNPAQSEAASSSACASATGATATAGAAVRRTM